MRLIIEAAARADIDRTVNWYNEQDSGLGTLFLDALSSRMERIVMNPRIFLLRRGGVRGASVRKFPYTIYFKHTDDTVQVIAVLHHRRDVGVLKDRSG